MNSRISFFSHFFGMLLMVKENEAPDPTDVGALGA
jgi:hypothetical protein